MMSIPFGSPTSQFHASGPQSSLLDTPETSDNCGDKFCSSNGSDTIDEPDRFPPELGIDSDFRRMQRERCGDDWLRGRNLYFLSTGMESSKLVKHYDDCCTGAAMYHNSETGQLKVISGACNLRFCPICARKRAFKVSRDIADWLANYDSPRFLTLTQKHSKDSLKYQIDRFQANWRKFYRSFEFKAHIEQAIWALQVTFNHKTKTWNPHIHILYKGEFWEKREIIRLWKRITGDSFIVDIESVNDREKAVDYISRYVGRPCSLKDIPESKYSELYWGTKGRRLFGQVGNSKPKIIQPPIKLDKSKWVKLGSLKQMIQFSAWDWDSWRIIKAWQAGEPIMDVLKPMRDCILDYNQAGELCMWSFDGGHFDVEFL
jgi:hypothetical protein